jgi:demethylmenaquinone methyltransferase/2-methoxy-6-polyprenyl-1,4-benzoquinol methylase
MDDRVAEALERQLTYYRRRAPDYDRNLQLDEAAATAVFDDPFDRLSPRGTTLELACGTGIWTAALVSRVPELTVLDAAPEMLAIARRRVPNPTVRFVQADVFSFEPDRRFDTLFFGFFLSHVPPQLLDSFWDLLARLVNRGGQALFFDHGPGEGANDRIVPDTLIPSTESTLSDGTVHRVVKVLHDPAELQAYLADRGWEALVWPVGDVFIAGRAVRASS